MSSIPSTPFAGRFDPLALSGRSFMVKLALVLGGTLVLAVASRISVPMVPVPITLQTLALTMMGVLYGWRLALATVLAWLGEAALGLPVLANGASGLAPFFGPTAGYLLSFPLIAVLAGVLAEQGWTGRRLVASFIAHFSANLLCLMTGWAWLAVMIGAEKAFFAGVAPFMIGAMLKSALAAALLFAMAQMPQPK
ncbi:biotin transporter BioY [Rhizobium paknamense]|uniref:Biotin transporter n=1 Tax=Rhizobium paknamense TaxID=1206817 RepID=A0ABU0IA64_9HYPH|nr:biotin transporter BioY [Rhizobium paknamense]MDQ0455114.1 biotin transport system substrate-specific component [Rhizobium paknamense]